MYLTIRVFDNYNIPSMRGVDNTKEAHSIVLQL